MVALEVIDAGDERDASAPVRLVAAPGCGEAGPDGGPGLAAVVAVVRQCEGAVVVERDPGPGTRIVVLLPRRAVEAARPRGATPAATGAEVLVVEDSDAIRRLTSRLLVRAGYRVTVAADGVAALELVVARAAAFDLVLTDLTMPRMGGFELARRLAVLRPRTRVLFMTGFAEELAAASSQAPAIACLLKPFTPAQLLGHVAGELADRDHERSA